MRCDGKTKDENRKTRLSGAIHRLRREAKTRRDARSRSTSLAKIHRAAAVYPAKTSLDVDDSAARHDASRRGRLKEDRLGVGGRHL